MDDEYQAYIKTWFAQLAPYYGIFDALVKGVRADVVDVANAPQYSQILDVATGTGAQAFAFAQRGYAVIGIDLSEGMLGVAKRHNAYDNVTFEVADAAQMPFEDDQFDVSCISFALHDMPWLIRERVLREMVRVSKSNGTIIMIMPCQRQMCGTPDCSVLLGGERPCNSLNLSRPTFEHYSKRSELG